MRTDLSNAASNVSRAVASKATTPALEGVLIKAYGSQLEICGYDLEIGIVTKIDASVSEEGEIVVSARLFNEIVRKLPDGIDSEVSAGGSNYSGGQRQRLTIARAIMKKPEILILDDSASALDMATDAALRAELAGMKGMTVFIISQRVAAVKGCDKILVLDNACLVGQGTHEELLENCSLYREICSSQGME